MYGSLGSLMALLLLIGVCSVMLLRIERFDNPVLTEAEFSKALDKFDPARKGALETLVKTYKLEKSQATVDLLTNVAKVVASPSPSDGTSSKPGDLLGLLSAFGIAGGSLQQGTSFNTSTNSTTKAATTTPAAANTEQVTALQKKVDALSKKTKEQQNDINVYKERYEQSRKRCPDISQYIRKDSIPCYNCTL